MAAPPISRARAAAWQRAQAVVNRHVVPRVFLVAMSLIYLSPIYWMVITGLKSNQELTAFPPHFWPHSLAFSNYAAAATNFPFLLYLVNSTIYAVLTVIGSVLSNFLIAYGFSRVEWPGRELLFYPVVASIFIFIQFPVNPITMIPLFAMFTKLHWVNTFLPLVLPAFFGNPFFIFLLRQFMLQIPMELSDAARIDGANEVQIMARVIMPLARPAIAVVALLAGVNAWNDFLGPLIYLQKDSLYTLSIGLQFFKTLHGIQFNLLMAASTLVVIPVMLLFLFFQRYFIEGITVGSIR
jgi:multiple sugar transport system permease protein